jgi:hypothetical protein
MEIAFVFVYASRPSSPNSRPHPDWRLPPNGVSGLTAACTFTPTWPESTARATRTARDTSWVQTDPDRPYCVELTSASISASSRKRIAVSTGPKISSRAIVICDDASANNTGRTKWPGPSTVPPPHTIDAPSSRPEAMYPSTRARCRAEISGPSTVPGVIPSPTGNVSAKAAIPATTSSCTSSCTNSRVPAMQACPLDR